MPIRRLIWTITTLLLVPVAMGAQARVATTVGLEMTTPTTVAYGEPIDETAQVTASDGSTVTGTVTFYDGTKSFCTMTVATAAGCPGSGFSVGAHVLTAVYSGDATHAGATSGAVTLTVQPGTTTTMLESSSGAVAVGGNVVYTARVAAAHGPVSGVVTFLDGSVPMGSTSVSGSGTATLSVLMLVAGDHAITAEYEGNGNQQASTSAAVHVVVQGVLATTRTTISTNSNAATVGQSVTFTAKVAAAAGDEAPSGIVTFADGGVVAGSSAVTEGTAAWSTSSLSAGNHSIVAQYAGNATMTGSVSAPVEVVVEAPNSQDGLVLGATTVTVAAGDTASLAVQMQTSSGLAKAMALSCSGLPEESSCSYAPGSSTAGGQGTATLRISTSAPRDCGSSTPYGDPVKSAGIPLAGGPVLAGVLLLWAPRRRRAMKRLLAVLCAVSAMSLMTGCGIGACTDLGTKPGTYSITVTGSAGADQVSQTVTLVVTP